MRPQVVRESFVTSVELVSDRTRLEGVSVGAHTAIQMTGCRTKIHSNDPTFYTRHHNRLSVTWHLYFKIIVHCR